MDVFDAGRLRLTYDKPTRGIMAKDFVLNDDNPVKELGFSLTESEWSFLENLVPIERKFSFKLELSDSPWPDGLTFPYGIPLEYYGK